MGFTLLKVDNKLIIISLHLTHGTGYTCNITDDLTDQVIRKVILNNDRAMILTETKLYYLYEANGFKLVDVTKDVASTVNISDITFITNSHSMMEHFGIYTTQGAAYHCKIKNHMLKSIKFAFNFGNKDIVAVSNRDFGYIYRKDNKYIVEEYSCIKEIKHIGTLDELPTDFTTPDRFLCGNDLMSARFPNKVAVIVDNNITCMYNQFYYVKDNIMCCLVKKKQYGEHDYGKHITDHYKVLNAMSNFRIVLVDVNGVKTIKCVIFKDHSTAITYSIPVKDHAENLGQYSNDDVDVDVDDTIPLYLPMN